MGVVEDRNVLLARMVAAVSYREILRRQLRIDEDVREHPYDDKTGKRVRALEGNTTIGCGHNLDAKGLPAAVIEILLELDIDEAEADARALVKNFDQLTRVRQAAVVNMAFNLGRDKLAGFRQTLRAINEGRFDDAARGMRASLWARQTKARAERLAVAMEQG